MNIWESQLGTDAIRALVETCNTINAELNRKQYTRICQNDSMAIESIILKELADGAKFEECIQSQNECVLVFKK